jgi:hypothetical protein
VIAGLGSSAAKAGKEVIHKTTGTAKSKMIPDTIKQELRKDLNSNLNFICFISNSLLGEEEPDRIKAVRIYLSRTPG